jgi:DNA primase large subunit
MEAATALREKPTQDISVEDIARLGGERLQLLARIAALAGSRGGRDHGSDALLAQIARVAQADAPTHLLSRPRQFVELKASNVGIDCESTRADNISHYVLRLAVCGDPELSEWFVRQEKILLAARLHAAPVGSTAALARVLCPGTTRCSVNDAIEAFAAATEKATSVPRSRERATARAAAFLDALDRGPGENEPRLLRSPFREAAPILSGSNRCRKVLMASGFVYLSEFALPAMVEAAFAGRLRVALERRRHCLVRLRDERLEPILARFREGAARAFRARAAHWTDMGGASFRGVGGRLGAAALSGVLQRARRSSAGADRNPMCSLAEANKMKEIDDDSDSTVDDVHVEPNAHAGASGRAGANAALTVETIGAFSLAFPPCMRQMLGHMREQRRLRHEGRLQLTSFLRAVGMRLDDCLALFRACFVASPADRRKSTSAVGMTADAYRKKRYAYSIRHLYGQEGKRVAMPAYSCRKVWAAGPPRSGEQHGCPFQTLGSRPSTLKSLLVDDWAASDAHAAPMPEAALAGIVGAAQAGRCGDACRLHFQACWGAYAAHAESASAPSRGRGDAANGVGMHPAAYYAAAMAVAHDLHHAAAQREAVK